MIADYMFLLSNDQAITNSAASDNYADLGAANMNLNVGSPLHAHVFVTTGFTSTANTLTIDVRNDGNTPPTTKHQEIQPAIATSSMTAAMHLCHGTLGRLGGAELDGRYLNMYYTVSLALVQGKVWSCISDH